MNTTQAGVAGAVTARNAGSNNLVERRSGLVLGKGGRRGQK